MRVALTLALFAPLAFAAMPAQAQIQDGDRVASAAIAKGDYSGAERMLTQELRIYPNRPELLLNLATVYARTGRQADARALYRRVLDQDDVLMDLSADRIAGSHAIAEAGLRQLGGAQVAATR